MPYLIDGNNVMAQRVGWHKDKRAARRRLLEDLARFGASHGARIAVVFDGAPDDPCGWKVVDFVAEDNAVVAPPAPGQKLAE